MASPIHVREQRLAPSLLHPRNQRDLGVALLISVVVLLWLYSIVPGMVSAANGGRSILYSGTSATVDVTAARSLATAISYFIMAVGAVLVLLSSGHIGRFPVSAFVGLLAPWMAVNGVHWLSNGASIDIRMALYLMVIYCFCAVRFPAVMVPTLARIIYGTAILSIGLGVTVPWAFMAGADQFEKKAIIFDSTLAGPFSHSNTLGLVMAFGIPFILTLHNRERWIAVLATSLALVWSASRSGLIAAGIIIIAHLLVHLTRHGSRRVVGSALLVGVASVIVVVPLTTTDPLAFTGRGRIWIFAVQMWHRSEWLGFGVNAFQPGSPIVTRVGYASSHGHNTFVSMLAEGGILGLAGLGLMVIFLATRAIKAFPDPLPFTLMVAFLATGIAEGRNLPNAISDISFIVWPLLACLALRERNSSNRQSEQTEKTNCNYGRGDLTRAPHSVFVKNGSLRGRSNGRRSVPASTPSRTDEVGIPD